MIKNAYRWPGIQGSDIPLRSAIGKRGVLGAAVGGLGGGALGGAISGLPKKDFDLSTGNTRTRSNTERAVMGGIGALSLGIPGAIMGGRAGILGAYNRLGSKGFETAKAVTKFKPPAWAQGAKSKADFKKAYHSHARKIHPDLGGDTEKFKSFQGEWDELQKHPKFPKQAMVAFSDELMKILNLG